MSTPDATQGDWRAALQPILDALETERKRAQQNATMAGWIIAAITLIVVVFLIATNNFPSPVLVLPPFLVGAAIFAYVFSSANGNYKSGFKSWVLPHLVTAFAVEIGGALEYSQRKGIEESEFNLCGVFRRPDRYHSEDLIAGKIGQTAFRFAEVHAESLQTRRNFKGETSEDYRTIFKGLFFVADFNKRFLSTTVILPDTMQPMLGGFGQNLQEFGTLFSSAKRELVRLEDPDFERAFAVYSSDQIEARYILSPALMRRLVEFRARCNADIRVVFSTGQMKLAIPLGMDWLEAPSLSTPLTLQSLELCLQQLRFACGIVSDMDLNTRIWSK